MNEIIVIPSDDETMSDKQTNKLVNIENPIKVNVPVKVNNVDVHLDFLNLIKEITVSKIKNKAPKRAQRQNIDNNHEKDTLIKSVQNESKILSIDRHILPAIPQPIQKIDQVLIAQKIKFKYLIRSDTSIQKEYERFKTKINLILTFHACSQNQFEDKQYQILAYMFNHDFKKATLMIKLNPLAFYNFFLSIQLTMSTIKDE